MSQKAEVERKINLYETKKKEYENLHELLDLAKLENDSDFHRKIIFSDEAHFWLNGFINKQNMCYWSDSNPHVLHESSLHPEKITVRFMDRRRHWAVLLP